MIKEYMKQTVEEVAREAAEDCYECHYDDSLEMRLVKEAFDKVPNGNPSNLLG